MPKSQTGKPKLRSNPIYKQPNQEQNGDKSAECAD
jgi:hypothetical protein